MVAYELMVILNPELSEEERSKAPSNGCKTSSGEEGEISNLDKWGKRRLAYEVKKFRRLLRRHELQISPGVAAELERIIKITDNIIRYLLIRDEKAGREPRKSRKKLRNSEKVVLTPCSTR